MSLPDGRGALTRMDDPSQAPELVRKGQGVRLSARYSRILAVFVIWAGFGIAILMFATQQWFFGLLLTLICLAAAAIAIDGRLLKERVHSKFDLITQWLAMISPIVVASMLLIALGPSLLRPVVPYVLSYVFGIVVVLVFAYVELRKGVRD